MKEAISINVGQAGVQVSNAAWELFCMEHGIRSDGKRVDALEDDDERCEVFFQALTSTFVPRVITVDFEPTVIDEIRVGAYRQLFHPDQLISGTEDCANNFARGNYTVGKIYLKTVMRQVIKLVENCDCLQGFCLLNSFDGGTGAGFSSCLEEALSFHYGKKPKMQLGVYPCRRMATSIVYPYNAVFHTHATMNHTDLSVLMDNEAIYNICTNKLNLMRPSYSNINRIIAQLFSSITVSMRFKNFLNSDIDQICTNLIPYPRIHFPLSHLAPLMSMDLIDKEPSNITEIARDIFDADNQMVQCDTDNGRFMACVMQFRGPVSPNEVNKAIMEIKRRTDIQFVDWCPTGFKIGINNKPLACPPGSCMAPIQKSLSMLSNTSAIVETWSDLLQKFSHMFSHKAFLHWFVGEGLEEGEFNEAYDNIKTLEMDYLEVSVPSNDVLIEVGKRARSRDKSENTVSTNKSKKSTKRTASKDSNLGGGQEKATSLDTKGLGKKSSKDSSRQPSRKGSSEFKDENGPPTASRKNTGESKQNPSSEALDKNGPPTASRKSTKESTRKDSSEFKDNAFDENGPSVASRKNTKDSTVKSMREDGNDVNGPPTASRKSTNELPINDFSEIKDRATNENVPSMVSKKSTQGSIVKSIIESGNEGPPDASRQNTKESIKKDSSEFKDKELSMISKKSANESMLKSIKEDNNDGPPPASRTNTKELTNKESSVIKDNASNENGPSMVSKKSTKESMMMSIKEDNKDGPIGISKTNSKEVDRKVSLEFKGIGFDEPAQKSTKESTNKPITDYNDIYDEKGTSTAARKSTANSTNLDALNEDNPRKSMDAHISKESEHLLARQASSVSITVQMKNNVHEIEIKKSSRESVQPSLAKISSVNDENGPRSANRRSTLESQGKASSGYNDGNDAFGPPGAIRRSTKDSTRRDFSDLKGSAVDEFGAPEAVRRSTIGSLKFDSVEYNSENGRKNSKESLNNLRTFSKGSSDFKDCIYDEFGPSSAVRRSTIDSSLISSLVFKDYVNDDCGPPPAVRLSTMDSIGKVSSIFGDDVYDDNGPGLATRVNTEDSIDCLMNKPSVESKCTSNEGRQSDIIRKNTNESAKIGTSKSNTAQGIEERSIYMFRKGTKDNTEIPQSPRKTATNSRNVFNIEIQAANLVKEYSRESMVPIPPVRNVSLDYQKKEK